MKHKKIFFCTLFAIILLFGFVSSSGGEEDDLFEKIGAKQMKVKKMAPNFSLEDLKIGRR